MTPKKKETDPPLSTDPGPERIVEDGRLGLDRLREFTKRVLKVRKASVEKPRGPPRNSE